MDITARTIRKVLEGEQDGVAAFSRQSIMCIKSPYPLFVGEIAPRSRTRDEGRPLGAGLQGQASNYPKLLRSRAVVVSVGGKGTA
jgi:hypothetical protein